MSHSLLFPNKYKIAGWCLLIPATIFGIILTATNFDGFSLNIKVFALFNNDIGGKSQFFSIIYTDVTNTIIGILFIVGSLLVGFSKEKKEDEFIANLRLSSLLWAVFVNYGLLLVAFAFIYGTSFLNIMVYNMFTVMIIFIIRFNYMLYRSFKSAPDEK